MAIKARPRLCRSYTSDCGPARGWRWWEACCNTLSHFCTPKLNQHTYQYESLTTPVSVFISFYCILYWHDQHTDQRRARPFRRSLLIFYTLPHPFSRAIDQTIRDWFFRPQKSASIVSLYNSFFCTPIPTKEWQQQCWREAVAVLASCTRAWCLVPAGHCIVVPQFYDSCYSSTPSKSFSWLLRVLLPPIMTGMTSHLFRSGLLLLPFSCKIRNH